MPRLDSELFLRGLAESRARAKELILNGEVLVNGKIAAKPAYIVEESDYIEVLDSELSRFVSRGGRKLLAALSHFEISAKGKICLDIGASTGGFTDCLLQNGASLVFAVDSGSSQLHPKLLSDSRVVPMENQNARFLTKDMLRETPTLAVMDVSFISQTLIHPALSFVLPAGSELITLIKPQFELNKSALSKNGIVRSEKERMHAVTRVTESLLSLGFRSLGVIPSPITGGSGNHEFLGAFVRL